MKTPIAAVKSSGAEPPAAMKVAPATSSLIPPEKRGYFTPKQKHSGSHESCVSFVLDDSTNKKM
jgi:hypothetical protein